MSADGGSAIKPATKNKPGKKRAAAAAAVPTPAPVDDSSDAVGAAAAPAAPRKARVPKKYIEHYGDEDLTFEQQLANVSEAEWLKWKEAMQERIMKQTRAQWAAQKTAFIKRKRSSATKKNKRKSKPVNAVATAAKHYERLIAMPAAEFAILDGKWLSSYGFDGAKTAAELDGVNATDVPEDELDAFTVYNAAKAHGFAPLGIVSHKEATDKATKVSTFKTAVVGDREYVGPALPFMKRKKSVFSMQSSDKVFAGPADEANDGVAGNDSEPA